MLDGRSPSESWSEWSALEPGARRTALPDGADEFDRLRHDHVFLSAGPPCFALAPRAYGDSVMYFDPAVDAELSGYAAPFDTGSCRPRPKGFLQPYAGGDAGACSRMIAAHSVPTDGWRAAMQEWLEHCYEDCARYLETGADPHSDGTPDRTRPPEILDNNGSAGRQRHGRACADRRAWTWEVRTTAPVSLRCIKAIHVTTAALETAVQRSMELAVRHGMDVPKVIAAPGEPTSPAVLYRDSKRVLQELIGGFE